MTLRAGPGIEERSKPVVGFCRRRRRDPLAIKQRLADCPVEPNVRPAGCGGAGYKATYGRATADRFTDRPTGFSGRELANGA